MEKRKLRKDLKHVFIDDAITVTEFKNTVDKMAEEYPTASVYLSEDEREVKGETMYGMLVDVFEMVEETDEEYNARLVINTTASDMIKKVKYQNLLELIEELKDEPFFNAEDWFNQIKPLSSEE